MTEPNRKTIFSLCRNYRYTLWRHWGSLPGDDDLFTGRENGLHRDQYVQFIGLNPSTADEQKDDPTIRRCIQFAKDWGYGSFCMTNLFAYRATVPADMTKQQDPVGVDNDKWLQEIAKGAGLIVAAWGTLGGHRKRDIRVRELIPNLHCLGLTAGNHPRHPLYVAGDTRPQPYKIS